jgi:MFS family permease
MTAHIDASSSAAARRRALIASLTGSSIEWFDYFLYGTAAALVFNKLFFPNFDPVVGLMLSYLSFSLTFFIRPLGGVIFAHIGDRIGRKKTLVITLSLMGGATVLIGLLPTYEHIGVWAPILLILLRMVQGLGIGGEWGGALLLAYEYAPANRKGFFGSVPQVGVTIGMLLATLSVSLMVTLPDESFMAWGWRVPFVLSAGLVFLGLWIRNGLDETPEFKQAKESGNVAKMPLVETLGFDKSAALNAVMIGALVASVLIPTMGLVSDYVGRKTVYVVGCVLLGLFIIPYFMLLDTKTVWGLTLATVISFGVLWSPITAVLGTLSSEIFATKVRYTGITLGYQLGAALAGGTAPLIATWLLAKYEGSWHAVAAYLLVTVLISLIAIIAISRSRSRQ